MSVFTVCMCVHYIHVCLMPMELGKGVGSHETGVMEGCELVYES